VAHGGLSFNRIRCDWHLRVLAKPCLSGSFPACMTPWRYSCVQSPKQPDDFSGRPGPRAPSPGLPHERMRLWRGTTESSWLCLSWVEFSTITDWSPEATTPASPRSSSAPAPLRPAGRGPRPQPATNTRERHTTSLAHGLSDTISGAGKLRSVRKTARCTFRGPRATLPEQRLHRAPGGRLDRRDDLARVRRTAVFQLGEPLALQLIARAFND
jgi:hypothetical protein